MPDITPKTETKEFPKSARIAQRELAKAYNVAIAELAETVAEELGLKAEDRWRFDQRTLTFVREVK